MTNQDPAARPAAFFAEAAAKAKKIANEKRQMEAAKRFRLDQFHRDEQARRLAKEFEA